MCCVRVRVPPDIVHNQQDTDSSTPWVDVLSDKSFARSYGSTTCNLTVANTNIEAGIAPHCRPSATYTSIAMSAVPVPEDGTDNLTDPSAPWLQLYTLKGRSAALAATSRKDKGRDLELLEATMHSETSTRPAGMVDVRASGRDKFHILVDGTVFGPFSRVRLGPSRCMLPRPTISVMTFQPTDV